MAPAVAVGTPVAGTVIGTPVVKPVPLDRQSSCFAALAALGWPPGLTAAMSDSVEAFPARFVIVDNSGSMQAADGSRLVKAAGGSLKPLRATRWEELGDVVMEMGAVAEKIGSPTHFHLLNRCHHGQYFTVGEPSGGTCIASAACGTTSLEQLRTVMRTSPQGTTPLTEAVQQVTSQIAPAAAKLSAHGQKVVVVVCTDGRPNNPTSFLRAVRELQSLPVFLVVRLCTDQDDVVEYWSDLDKQLETPLEVLDDVSGEAKEVHRKNPWLSYAPALHLARTMGLHEKLFDLMDEAPLLPSQAKRLCECILGCAPLPEPEVEPEEFTVALDAALARLPPVYNPVRRAMMPWVDAQAVLRKGGGGKGGGGDGGCVIC